VPAAYVQSASASTTNDATTTVATPNFASSNTLANLIVYFIAYDNNSAGGAEPTISISDTRSNTYAKAGSFYDATNGLKIEVGYAKNIAAGANAVTCTYGGSLATTYFKGILAQEFSGLDTATPFVTGEVQIGETLSNSAGTDTLVSGNLPALASQPALILGFTTLLRSLGAAMTAGTGFALNGPNFWDFGFTGNTFGGAESKRVLSTAATQATFSTTDSVDIYLTAAMALHEPGAAPTFPPVPGSPNTIPGFQQHNALMVN
jgi:hypothetical protein